MSWLFRIVVQRAIAQGSGRFAALGVVFAFLKFVNRMSGGGERVLYKHALKPGDVLVVREPKTPR